MNNFMLFNFTSIVHWDFNVNFLSYIISFFLL